MELYLEWAKNFAEHKDIFHKEIVDIKKIDNVLEIFKKNSKEIYIAIGKDLIEHHLNSLKKYDDFEKIWLVVENDSDKIKEVVACWDILSTNKKIRIWFVNVNKDQKWALNPYIHSVISPKNKLKKSLDSLMNAL